MHGELINTSYYLDHNVQKEFFFFFFTSSWESYKRIYGCEIIFKKREVKQNDYKINKGKTPYIDWNMKTKKFHILILPGRMH